MSETKRVESVLMKIAHERDDWSAPSVEGLLAWMKDNGIPSTATISYGFCGSHDFDLEWIDE